MENDQLSISRYPAYKDSGIDWLGKIPTEWIIARNKEVFKERSSLSTTGKETLLTVSHITGVTPRSEKNVNMFMAETLEGYKICHQGDLVINTMWAWMGALGTSNELGICSPSYNVYMPVKGVPYNHRYFDYLFRIPNSIVEMTRNSKGIVSSRLRLYAKDFFQIETVLPSLKEQETIAHYLDTKTAQIDRKIDLLTQKAKLYSNLKQSLINETVTRGLDKSVAMKDSGIDAIGEIPKHWGIYQFKNVAFYQEGPGLRNWQFTNEGIKVISVTNITPPIINFEKLEKYISFDEYCQSYKHFTVQKDDLLLASSGASWGKVSTYNSDEKVILNTSTIRIHAIKESQVSTQLIRWILQSGYIYDSLITSLTGSCQPNFGPTHLNRLYITFPPLSEQKAIADYLDTKTAQIDQIIQTLNTQIEKLKELRKTLINDVVTGKIKITSEL